MLQLKMQIQSFSLDSLWFYPFYSMVTFVQIALLIIVFCVLPVTSVPLRQTTNHEPLNALCACEDAGVCNTNVLHVWTKITVHDHDGLFSDMKHSWKVVVEGLESIKDTWYFTNFVCLLWVWAPQRLHASCWGTFYVTNKEFFSFFRMFFFK